MYETSFLVPQEGMTLTAQNKYKEDAINFGVARMLALKLVTNQDDLTVRVIRAFTDFGVGTITEEEWRFNLALGLNAGALTVLARPANQIVVFWGIDNFDTNPEVTLVTFRTAAVGGTTKMMVDCQITRGLLTSSGFLSQPVVYDPQQNIIVDINADAASATQQCIFNGYIVEPRGQVLS